MSSPPDLTELLTHADWVQRLARQLCADAHAAADAAQDTWLATLRHPPRSGEERPWLARVLRRSLGQQRRSDRRRQAREQAADAGQPFAEAAADAAARLELHRFLVEQVRQLGEPQRTLILLHYFEGHDTDALAARLAISPDAVRAHLRRGRDALRARLRSAPATTYPALAALTLAAKPTATLATFATIMSIKKLALGAGLAAIALLSFWPGDESADGADHEPEDPATLATARDLAASPAPSAAQRHAVATAPPAAALTLSGHLRGLIANVPWDQPLIARCKGFDAGEQTHQRDDTSVTVASDGSFIVPLPAWSKRAAKLDLRLRGDPTFYQPTDESFEISLPSAELVIDVHAVGVITGRVLDTHHQPVAAARIATFLAAEGSEPLAQTGTGSDGRFTLQTPAGASLLLAAAAMHEASLSGARMTMRHGAIADLGTLRADLLPITTTTACVAGGRHDIGDLILPGTAAIQGRAVWHDGSPVASTHVRAWPTGVRTLTFGEQSALSQQPDGRFAPVAQGVTDTEGRFALPGLAGVTTTIDLALPEGHVVIGGGVSLDTTAPATVELRVPPTIVLRATRDGAVLADAEFEVPKRRMRGNAAGELRVVLQNASKRRCLVRAAHGARRSAWRDLAGVEGQVDLELDQALAPVRIEIDAGAPVRQVALVFTPLSPGQEGGSFLHTLHRDDRSGPFQLAVPPGRYRVHIAGAPGERSATFLMESTHELDVPAAGGTFTLPGRFGGRLQLEVRDALGTPVPGKVTLFDAAGTALLPLFSARGTAGTTQGLPGELLGAGRNQASELLAPGTYRLELDLGARGVHREAITVRAREDNLVRLRLR